MRNFSPLALAAVAALVVLLPLATSPVVASEMLAMGIAAVAANLLLGYSGMLSFGQAMFFGFGAYAAGILQIRLGVPMLVALPLGAAATALVALPIGFVCTRLVGFSFIMITFAFNQMLYFIAYSWSSLTGGEDGLPGIDRPDWVRGEWSFYVFVAVVFLVALALMKRMVDSPTGRILQAIRDNPQRAAAAGHDVARYKLVMFVISAAFTGLAGATYAFVFHLVAIDKIHWLFSGDIVFMTLLGGTGHFLTPAAGAILYIWLQDTISLYWNRWPLVVGIMFALVVLFFRSGLGGLLDEVRARFAGRRAPSPAEAPPAPPSKGTAP